MSDKAKLEEIKQKLAQQERTEGRSGAVPLDRKTDMLDLSDLEAKNPDKRYRWVRTGGGPKSDKGLMRQKQGYEKVSESEGGRSIGNLEVFSTSKEHYEARVAEQKREHERRLNAHNKEVQEAAEVLARDLRDRFGVSINPERIFTRE